MLGMGLVATKKLIDTHPTQIAYYVSIILISVNSLIAPTTINDDNYHRPTMLDLFKGILFSGIPLVCGMLTINTSMLISHRYGLIMPFQFTAIIVGYLISIVRYGENINWVGVGGTIAIVFGVIFLLRNKTEEKYK